MAVRIAGIVTAVALLTAGTVSTGKDLLRRTDTFEEALPATLTSVTIEGGAASVDIAEAGPGEAPSVEATTRGMTIGRAAEVEVTRTSAHVRAGCEDGFPGLGIGAGFGPGREPCTTTVVVRVPAGADVSVAGSAGEVYLERLAGDVDVDLVAGEVVGRGLSGQVTADVDAGAITLTDSGSTTLDADVRMGEVVIEAIVAPEQLRAHTTAGDVTVRVPDDGTAYRVLGGASGAERTLDVPVDDLSARVLDVAAGFGTVSVGREDATATAQSTTP